jgi:hypothetical protein
MFTTATIGTTPGQRRTSNPAPGAPAAPAHATSPPRAGRRVSFDSPGAAALRGSVAGGGGKPGAVGGAAVAAAGEERLPHAQTLAGEDAAARKERRAKLREGRKKPAEEVEEQGGDYVDDDRSVMSRSSTTSLFQKVALFAGLPLLGGADAEREASDQYKAHPKHCMCGCRAY